MVASCGSAGVLRPPVRPWLRPSVASFLLLTQLLSPVRSVRPPPPGPVQAGPLLRWSAPPAPTNLSYTVQSLRYEAEQWTDFPPCVRSQETSCNVTADMERGNPGCVRLRVLAHGDGLTSDPTEACSPGGTACSPEVQLSSQPGVLTVHLRGNHSLVYQYGNMVQHRISLGREGGPLLKRADSPSSKAFQQLEEGARYCVSVVLVYYGTPVGPPSCVKCLDVPRSGGRLLGVTLGVGFFVAVAVLLLLYVLLFQGQRVKEWMRPPYVEPNCIRGDLSVEPQQALTYNPREELCDRVSLLDPVGQPSA